MKKIILPWQWQLVIKLVLSLFARKFIFAFAPALQHELMLAYSNIRQIHQEIGVCAASNAEVPYHNLFTSFVSKDT
jgi:hypothetical protein